MNSKEALQDLRERVYCRNNGEFFERLDIIEQELIDGEKNKQALEIIKNNIFEFIFIDITKLVVVCFGETSWNYYCKTQEEYDLLKEVLL